MKVIEKIVVSSTEPNGTNVGWIQPKEGNKLSLKVYVNGSWRELSGGESSDGSSSDESSESSELANKVEALEQTIEDNELIIAAALNDLNNRLAALELTT